MPYLLVSDFQGGQDVRKSEFTAPPGTLRRLINAHISRGGEIEQRKAFQQLYTLPAGTFGLHSVNGQLVVYGTAARPVGLASEIVYYQVTSVSAASGVDRVLSTDNFGGVAYAVIQFNDGAVEHYYGDQRVTAWDDITLDVASRDALAAALVARVNRSAVFSAEDITDAGADAQFTITGPAGEAFDLELQAVNDTSWTFSKAIIQSATSTPAVSAETTFTITGGSSGGGNQVTSILVDSVEILGDAVAWASSNDATAAAVAGQINAFSSNPEYTAAASGADVTIVAPAGADANGRDVIVASDGDVTTSAVADLSGGADAVPGLPQISLVTILEGAGSRLASSYYTVTLSNAGEFPTETYSVRLTETAVATFVKTVADQMYGAAQKVLRYTGFRVPNPATNPVGFSDPTAWDSAADDVVNAGLIDMSTQDGANDDVVAVGTYQNRIAIFSRRYIQIWAVGPAPEDKQQLQVLNNLGTVSPQTVASFGDQDVFFLSESGVRSLRARDSSNLASAADVGNPIDPELVDFVLQQSREDVEQAVAVVEPTDGRYWLALADRMYVFSFFSSSKVSAWSTYDLPGRITAMTLSAGRVYFRVGDDVYRYGGDDNRTFDDAVVEVRTPFMDGDNPAQHKSWDGMDVGVQGLWQVWVATDMEQPEVEEEIGIFGGPSFSMMRVPMVGESSHISVRLKSVGPGVHKLASMAIHYSGGDSG